jgi:hypothetical protein
MYVYIYTFRGDLIPTLYLGDIYIYIHTYTYIYMFTFRGDLIPTLYLGDIYIYIHIHTYICLPLEAI